MPLVQAAPAANNGCPIGNILTGENENDEKITLELKNVEVLNDEEKSLGFGNLYLTTEKVFWTPSDSTKSGSENSELAAKEDIFAFRVDYPSVLMHAICKDESVCSKPCLYCQVSGDPKDLDNDECQDLKFVPETEDELNKLFNIFSEMQMLWPDEDNDAISEGDEEMEPHMMEAMYGNGEGLNFQNMINQAMTEGCANPDIMAMLEQQMSDSMQNLNVNAHGNEDLDTSADVSDSLPSPPGARNQGWTLGNDNKMLSKSGPE